MQHSYEVSVFWGEWQRIRTLDSFAEARNLATWFSSRWKVNARVTALPDNDVVFECSSDDGNQTVSENP